ncbi:unnamed protein product [Pleuronectes platessa]|uniref:Uncharacterized protein n=1 Tax=Pleuronectes platessa TaxID=8262 RepID=A0A9N7TXQ8_PLEPL|nr:unnamed protein product [Pleuronectes platessa]
MGTGDRRRYRRRGEQRKRRGEERRGERKGEERKRKRRGKERKRRRGQQPFWLTRLKNALWFYNYGVWVVSPLESTWPQRPDRGELSAVTGPQSVEAEEQHRSACYLSAAERHVWLTALCREVTL